MNISIKYKDKTLVRQNVNFHSLTFSVIRLQQKEEAVELSHAIKYRRDVCFSQALTSLVSSLMARFWCLDPPDITFLNICRLIGMLKISIWKVYKSF